MKNFWPKRSSPKGFSIQSVVINYKKRLQDRIQNDSENLKAGMICFEKNKDSKKFIPSYKKSDVATFHWANRDFDEYLDIA